MRTLLLIPVSPSACRFAQTKAFVQMGNTSEMGECERPAFTPVTPHVSTPPSPFVLKDEPNTLSSLCFRETVISSRHRLDMAASKTTQGLECAALDR